AGFSMSTKERDVTLERVGINTTSTGVAAMDMTADVEELVNDAAFNDGYLIISNRTTATDSYGATDDITALYGSLKFDFADFQVLAGARYEDSSQSLSYPYSGSGDNTLDSTEVLPALNVNWFINEDYQLRFAASNTLSRPGITERSDSVQYDPETDDAVYGNPDLVISKISNLDIRLEYYMEEDENITLALFTKAITDPIERTVQDGSGSSSEGVTFENQDSADLMGLELDFRVNVIDTANWTGFVAGNFSYIDAEVTLSEDTAKLEGVNSRKLQGQSENLSNLQIGFDHEDTGQSVTLLLNHFSERIYAAGRGEGQDAVVEDGRMSVDLAYNFEMNDELSMKAKIGNITDAKVSYSQGGQEIESYQEGIDISAGVSYQF
ncbi:MAG: TonB-dependent receptor domain-containing protein, partial [Oceanobacter sp.]